MKIAGVQKTSFIDYPGKASTVVFLGGCNFKCGYCHNPEIVRGEGDVKKHELMAFLQKRKRFLDAVCISGGEPTLQEGLLDFIMEIRSLGYEIKLDTNGTKPKMIKALLAQELLDYVAMDLKGPLEQYPHIVSAPVDSALVKESVALLKTASADCGLRFELRTTVAKELLSEKDLFAMCDLVCGSERWYLQRVRGDGQLLDSTAVYTAYSQREMEQLAEKAQQKLRQFALERETKETCVSVR